MNIAVATRFEVFVVDDEGNYVDRILPHWWAEHFYGLTWSEEYMFVYCWGSHHWIEVLDHDLRPVTRLLGTPGRNIADAHQILWDRARQRLWVCDTGRERFVITNSSETFYLEWVPLPDRGVVRPTGPHINSLWFDKHGHVLFVASNWGEGNADIWSFDANNLMLVESTPGAHRAHSIYIHQDRCLTLGIREVCWGDQVIELPECEVMKGIVYADDRMFFGVQQNIPDREKRKTTKSGWMCEVDPNTLEQINMVNFGRGQVNEIRALDAVDHAHHGLPWMGKYGV